MSPPNFTLRLAATAAALLSSAVVTAIGAGPNTLGFYDATQMTSSANGTWFIVPLPKATVQSLVPYPLISSCATNKTLFPSGLPSGSFPVIVSTSYMFDIRMASLEIDSLTGGGVQVPCVDRLGDGKTPFSYSLASYIGGADGQALPAYVPALVGSLESAPITPANVYPNTNARRALTSTLYSTQVKALVVPNPVSGPGVIPAAIDAIFSLDAKSPIPARTFHSLINQPLIVNLTFCTRHNYYFNESFAQPGFVQGSVTLYGITGVQAAALQGRYTGVEGYAGNAQTVGYNPQGCAEAAAQNDPYAST